MRSDFLCGVLIPAVGNQISIDLFYGYGQRLGLLGVDQRQTAGNDLTGTLGRLYSQRIATVNFGKQFSDRGLSHHDGISSSEWFFGTDRMAVML